MSDIFISYAHKDKDRGIYVGNILREMGWDIWQDVHNLRPLGKFTEEIAQGIRECSIFLALFSKAYIESKYCEKEYNYAIDEYGKNPSCMILDPDFQKRNTRYDMDFPGNTLPGYGVGATTEEELLALCNDIIKSVEFVRLRAYRGEGNTDPMPLLTYTDRYMSRLKKSFDTAQLLMGCYGNHQEYDEHLAPHFVRQSWTDDRDFVEEAFMSEEQPEEDNEEGALEKNIPSKKNHKDKASLHEYLKARSLPDLIPLDKGARIVLYGSGGMGKTTAMLQYGRMLLHKQPLVCVHLADVRFCEGRRSDQLNNIEGYIHDKICVDDPVWKYIYRVGTRNEGEGYRLTILLDGLNELAGASILTAMREIQTISREWQSTDLIVSTRSVHSDHRKELEDFVFYKSLPPEEDTVRKYLEGRGITVEETVSSRMLDLLRNPLRLTLFVKTQPYYSRYIRQRGLDKLLHEKQDTMGKIMDNYLASQLYSFLNVCENSETEKAQITAFILCELVYPYIGWKLYCENAYKIPRQEVLCLLRGAEEQLAPDWQDYLESRAENLLDDYNFNEDYIWNSRRASGIMDRLNLMPRISGSNENDDEYIFSHQSFRDYFAARYLTQEIHRCVRKKQWPTNRDWFLFSHEDLSDDIIELVSDILEEERAVPICEKDKGWSFPGKKEDSRAASSFSPAEQMLDLLRRQSDKAARITVSNLIRVLRYARNDLLGQCCFDWLDLRDCNLRNAEFSLWYRQDIHPSSFDGAWISISCFSCSAHRAIVTALCPIGNDLLLSADADGMILETECSTGRMTGRHWTIPRGAVRAMAWHPETDQFAVASSHALYVLNRNSGDSKLILSEERKCIQKIRFSVSGNLEYSIDLMPMVWFDTEGHQTENNNCPGWFSGAYDVDRDGKIYWRSCMMRNVFTGFRNSQGDWEERGKWLYDLFPPHIAACAHLAKILRQLESNFPVSKKDRGKWKPKIEAKVWKNNLADPEIAAFRSRFQYYLYLQQEVVDSHEGHNLSAQLRSSIDAFLAEAPDINSKRISSIAIHPDGNKVLISSGTFIAEFDAHTMQLLNRVQLGGSVNSVCYLPGCDKKVYAAASWYVNVTVLDSDLNITSSCQGEPVVRKAFVKGSREDVLYLLCTDGTMRRLDDDFRISRIRRDIPHSISKYLDTPDGRNLCIAFPLLSSRWKSGELYNYDENSYYPLTDDYYQPPHDECSIYLRRRISKKVAYFMDRAMRVIPRDEPDRSMDVPYRGGMFVSECTFRNLQGVSEEEKMILYMNGGVLE